MKLTAGKKAFLIFEYVVCIFLAVLCILPFLIMIVNSTRSTPEFNAHPMSFIPSTNLGNNWAVLTGKDFNVLTGFLNSVFVSVGSTICTVYFSTLTAYAIVAYDWKLRRAFFTMILCVMMIPGQVTGIGYYTFMWKIGMTDNHWALILPTIAAPATVFFMRQFMLPNLSMEIVNSARIDSAGEFRIFNSIVLPIMKPAMATQAIFAFVSSWNSLFMPSILITTTSKKTMPMMVSLLKGDFYKIQYGAVYLGLTLTVLPLFVVYFMLSKYIIAGVALGGVKG